MSSDIIDAVYRYARTERALPPTNPVVPRLRPVLFALTAILFVAGLAVLSWLLWPAIICLTVGAGASAHGTLLHLSAARDRVAASRGMDFKDQLRITYKAEGTSVPGHHWSVAWDQWDKQATVNLVESASGVTVFRAASIRPWDDDYRSYLHRDFRGPSDPEEFTREIAERAVPVARQIRNFYVATDAFTKHPVHPLDQEWVVEAIPHGFVINGFTVLDEANPVASSLGTNDDRRLVAAFFEQWRTSEAEAQKDKAARVRRRVDSEDVERRSTAVRKVTEIEAMESELRQVDRPQSPKPDAHASGKRSSSCPTDGKLACA